MDLAGDDRVLAIAPVDTLREMAARAALVVGVFDGDGVYDARAALRDCSNVMIVPSDPEGTIPWKDEFFSVVYAPSASRPTVEMLRVLVSGGVAITASGSVAKR
jgi:hypothetical protein